MAGNEVKLVFAGDSQQLERTFAKVGDASMEMAEDVGKSSRRLAEDSDISNTKIAEGIDGSERKFRGLGDTIAGTGDIMQGFKDGNVIALAMGFADLAGGVTDFVVPAIQTMRTTILTGLAPALTAISAHPLIAGILIGGAIIGGLILLEKKFGLVSSAVGFLREGLDAVLGGIGAVIRGFRDLWNSTLGGRGFDIPGFHVPGTNVDFGGFSVRIPTLHTGGIAGRDTLAVLQQGETVIPRGQSAGGGLTINVMGSVITDRDLGRIVADALRQNKLIGVTV